MKLMLIYMLLPFLVVPACSLTSNLQDKNCKDYIKLEKSGCLINCKAYQITLCKNRTALYRGIHLVEKKGEFIRKISKQENEELWELVNNYKIYSLAPSYGPFGEDSQTCLLTVSEKGKKKIIRYGAHPPHHIIPFLNLIESFGETGEWKPIKQ